MERQRQVDVDDTPSNLGGSFTVSIDDLIDMETVVGADLVRAPARQRLGAVAGLERRAGIDPSHAERLAYSLPFAPLKDRAFAAAVADLKARIAEKEKTLNRRAFFARAMMG